MFFVLCVYRRRRLGSTLKHQQHTKTYYQCWNVCPLGGNTFSTSVRRNVLLPLKKRIHTVRTLKQHSKLQQQPACLPQEKSSCHIKGKSKLKFKQQQSKTPQHIKVNFTQKQT